MVETPTHEEPAQGADAEVAIAEVTTVLRRTPIDAPVRTSFGAMRDRPALFLRVRDADGAVGWGEAWCNFPSIGADYRARLTDEIVGPLLCGLGAIRVGEVFDRLMQKLRVLAIQSGEHGPLRQVAAGLDAACHDLAARRAGVPLWRFLGGAQDRVPVYASGIGPEHPGIVAERERARGHVAFKLKVGFGEAVDLASLRAIREAVGERRLMVDANQAWDVEEAKRMAEMMAAFEPLWLEEPIAADRPWTEWQDLAAASPIPLAAGENCPDGAAFEATFQTKALRYIQPDLAKWGGVSRCRVVGQRACREGLIFCPHFLGGGVGLLASAHVLAAVGGPGLLEVDSNPNPLREVFLERLPPIENGWLTLPDAPGIGVDPDEVL